MDNKIAAIIVVCAVVIIVGGAVVALALNGFDFSDDDDDYVVYYGNGHKTSSGDSTMKSTLTEVQSGGIFESDSKYFLVWNTKSDGSGTNYKPGENVTIGTKLYAIWGDRCVNAMSLGLIAATKNLSLSLFDNTLGFREMTFPAGLVNTGSTMIVISNWSEVAVNGTTGFIGKVGTGSTFHLNLTIEGTSYVDLDVKTDGDNKIAYIFFTPDKDVTISASVTT